MEQLNVMNREPKILDLNRIVIPRIERYWEDMAYALRYKIVDVDVIKEKHLDDPKRCCRELLKDWLSTNHGTHPKTWVTLLEAIEHIEELTTVREKFLQDLQLESEYSIDEYLAKAKRKNMVVKFQHIKILLSGSSAAGKSSFCRLLFNSKFSDEYNSTDIMEAKQAVTVKSFAMLMQDGDSSKQTDLSSEVVWLELDHENHFQHLKSLLVSHLFKNRTIGQEEISDDDDEDDLTSDLQTTVQRKIIKSSELSDSFKIGQTVQLITVLDTGGQPEYVMLLPAINSMPTINFVVHDLTKKLDDPVLVRYKKRGSKESPECVLDYSYLDMIQLLMCLFTDSLEQTPEEIPQCISIPKKAHVGFVGTHFDKIKNNPEIVQVLNDKLTCIVNERKCNFAVLPSQNGILHPVDNTTAGDIKTEDTAVKFMRDKIEKLTNRIESKELPITWMILQLEIQELRANSTKKYITYEEYKRIANKNAKIVDENEVKASLYYFHILGIVIHFSNSELCTWIVIDLQWLFVNLAKIMHLSLPDECFCEHSLKEKFIKQRLLAMDLLEEIQLEDVNRQEIEYFINTLIHLKVITIVTMEPVKYYYLPCALPALPSTMQYNDNCRFLLSEPLLIQFTSGYLPRGFFCSLVAHLLRKSEDFSWNHQLGNTSTKHYSNVITFQLPDKTFLRLHDKTYYLELHVRHYKKDINNQYHSEILPVLKKCFKFVCQQLRFDYEKIQYGFLCHSGYNSDDHMVVVGSLEDSELKTGELKCTRGTLHVTQIGEAHEVWFKKSVSQQDNDHKASQHSIVEGAVVIDQIKNKDDTPTMRDLNRYVTKKHATMWKDVGLELKLERGLLVTIQKDNQQDTVNCFEEVLDKWLRLTPSATWKQLEIALTNANRMQLGLNPIEDLYGPANSQ